MSARQDYIAGLRWLADVLENNADVPVGTGAWSFDPIRISAWDLDTYRVIVKALGNGDKGITSIGDLYFDAKPNDDFHVRAYLHDNTVCEKVQVGTRKATKTVETDEEVPVYEWHCPDSILKEDAQ